MTAAEQHQEIRVSDTPWTWLAIFAENYTATDRLYLQLAAAVEREPDNVGLRAHLQEIDARRRSTYSGLVAQVMECEALRLGQA